MSSLRRFDLDFGRWPLHHTTARWSSQEHSAAIPENDTIVSAAAVARLQVTGEFPIKWFYGDGANGEGGIACSSLLPIIWDGEETRDAAKQKAVVDNDSKSAAKRGKPWLYLPIPPKTLKIDTNSQLHLMKIVNGIAWLREDLWRTWAEGRWREAANAVLEEHFLPERPKCPKALSQFDTTWVKQSVQERVTLHPEQLRKQALSDARKALGEGADEDAIRNKAGELAKVSMPYRVVSYRFPANAGAALIVSAKDDDQMSQFTNALKILGKNGLGGDRTYGYGTFDVCGKPVELAETDLGAADGNAALTLGLMFPAQDLSIEKLSNNGVDQTDDASDEDGHLDCFKEYLKPLKHDDSRWKAVYRQGRNRIPDTDFYVMSKSARMVDKGALLAGLPDAANTNGAHVFPVGGSVNMFPGPKREDGGEGFVPEKLEPPLYLEPRQKCIVRSGRTIALKAAADAVDGPGGGK